MKHIDQVIKSNRPATMLKGDNNHCTVSALSASFDISFDQAYDYAHVLWNRKRGKGVRTLTMLKTFPNTEGGSQAVLGKGMTKIKAKHDYKQPDGSIKTRSMNLSTFTKKHPRGRYYILVKGHALSVIDGEIVDHTDKPKRRIMHAWKVG
jgi:hypothetical protein